MLGKIFSAAVEIVTLPVAVVKDVATLGLKKVMDEQLYTKEKLKEIEEKLEDIF